MDQNDQRALFLALNKVLADEPGLRVIVVHEAVVLATAGGTKTGIIDRLTMRIEALKAALEAATLAAEALDPDPDIPF